MNVPLKANDPCWCGSGRKYKRCHHSPSEMVRPGTLSPRRSVPESIARPEYVASGWPAKVSEPLVRTPAQADAMRRAGRVAAEVLAVASAALAPGVTTDEIDAIAHEACTERGAYPSPLNYKGYPKSICTSVNEVVCHGIPDDRRLRDGDIVNIDVTVFLDGVHGDTDATYPVGTVDRQSARLMATSRGCLERGIEVVKPGRRLFEIGRAIEAHAHAAGMSVVRDFVGHGIGEVFHNTLAVPHFFTPTASTVIEEGMTFTIEPMINLGTWRVVTWDDGWTAVTADGARSAQYEHTLLVTADGADVLTLAT
ncbi:MAG TPA: type I methionyl aminopeptidase [Acidimicrobiales bacterium]|nr:type I methionyl aminopeptidase [Acidimicrobiales bacterium]